LTTGEVGDIKVVTNIKRGGKEVKELPGGLTKQAIDAAGKIKFKPALKDGKAVSMYLQVEYKFTLPYCKKGA
jgi:hypothetical protein